MKTFVTITLAVCWIATSYSQINEKANAPKNYLGELNGNHFFYTGLSHIRTNKINLYQIEDSLVVQSETILLPNDRFEQLFLFNNTVYGLVSDLAETNYSLIRFDQSFREEKRIEIMPYKDNAQNLDQKALSSPVEQDLKIITHEGKALLYVSFHYVRIAVIDFENMQSKTYDFDVPLSTSFNPSDALFFNQTDAHATFEYWGGSLQTRRYYATFIDGKTTTFKLNDFEDNASSGMNPSSFKFIRIQDKNYLVSLLCKNKFGMKHIGFTFTEIKDIGISSLKLKPIINEKLNDKELWAKKNYKKWKHNSWSNLYRNSKLDEVYYINGQLIMSIRHDPELNMMSNLMISSLDIENPEKPTVNWNVVTHSGLFNKSDYQYNQNRYAYVLAQYPDHIRVFYNCEESALDKTGNVIKPRKEPNSAAFKSKYTDIAILDIDLKDGASHYLTNPYRGNEHYPRVITAPFYYISNNNIYFILEKIKPATTKEKASYTPSAVMFPVEAD
jgi:hypothetical protein